MTPKQNVLAVYPDALCDHNGPFGMHKIVVPHHSGRGYVYLSVLTDNPKRAWKYAWDRISFRMMEKLES